jgi:hypothetical protein
LSFENQNSDADPLAVAGRQHRRQRQSRAKAGSGVVKDPSTSRNNMHENRETSAAARRKAGTVRKGDCHNPNMHAEEGSDRAVVPMKLPNKEERLASAEAVEGRARSKENVAELYTSPTQSGEVRVPGVTRRARSAFSLRRHHPR